MQLSEDRQQLDEIIQVLPESKLVEIIDFANYLRKKEESDELFRLQENSLSYGDWLSPENDIYDEVFRDEVKQR